MTERDFETIDRDALNRKLASQVLDNDDPARGVALVNVLGKKRFEQEHIPDSINIPKGLEEPFERTFDKNKEIVVYCASLECDASPDVARELARRGFEHVYDYEAGMEDWKERGGEVAAGPDGGAGGGRA